MSIKCKTAVMISACVFAGSVLAVPAQSHEVADESVASGYQMAAVIDRASGNRVIAGNYAEAIEVLGRKSRRYFESSTNLCVAYTMTGELEKADAECASALAASEKSEVRREIAVALSNRGVVKAISGDASGAEKDFSRAIELSDELVQASDNLRRLLESNASDV